MTPAQRRALNEVNRRGRVIIVLPVNAPSSSWWTSPEAATRRGFAELARESAHRQRWSRIAQSISLKILDA